MMWLDVKQQNPIQPNPNQAAFALPELFVVVCELLRRFYLLKPAISILVLLGFRLSHLTSLLFMAHDG